MTEACTNVVLHAYRQGEEGPLEICADIDADRLSIIVRDHGLGITPRAGSPGLGLGLPLIASLAEAVELRRNEDDHTEVSMVFSLGPRAADSQINGVRR